MKLGLGTAQFGLDYGVSNPAGRTPSGEVARIVAHARAAGVRVLDTAPAYGDAESVLGEVGVEGFDVVTKTPGFGRPLDAGDGAALVASMQASLSRLRIDVAYGVLVHGRGDLGRPGAKNLAHALVECKGRGLVVKTGVSAYTAEEIEVAREVLGDGLELVQVPLNVFDQRLLRSGLLERLHADGVEVHIRSVFLQGLLLMAPEDVPESLARVRPMIGAWRAAAAAAGVTPLEGALGFLAGLPDVSTAVCGVNDVAQLRELLDALDSKVELDFDAFATEDVSILDPSTWEATSPASSRREG